MGALVNFSNRSSSNLMNNFKSNSNDKTISLLIKKLEDTLLNEKSIIVSFSIPDMDCKNTFCIDNYEIDEGNLYLNSNNFELHIDLNKVKIKYDYNFDAFLNRFSFINKGIEVSLIFLE